MRSIANVLIIEDDKDNAMLLEILLTRAGYQCDVALDGLKGLQKAIEKSPDIILVDMYLPGMHGLEIVQYLRENILRNMIIIAITAQSERITKHAAKTAGCDAYFSKPLAIKELLSYIEQEIYDRVIVV